MWQAAWLVPPGAGPAVGAGAGAPAGGSKASSCSTHDFLSRYGDGSSHHADHASARGASSLTTQDFLQPLERNGNGNASSRSAFRDGRVPSTSDKTIAGLDTARDAASALAPAAADRLVPRHNTAFPNPTTARANAALDSGSNSMSRKLTEGATVPDSVRPGPFHNSPALATKDSNSNGTSNNINNNINNLNNNNNNNNNNNRNEHSLLRHCDAAASAAADPDPDSADFFTRERAENLAYWSSVRLKFGMTDMAFGANVTSSQTPLEPSRMPAAAFNKQWQQPVQASNDTCNRRPIKVPSEDDDDEEDDYIDGRSREARKDSLFHKESTQKVDGKSDVRGGTPRSKHSATEQRRRSKINDRFQMLRQLVPHSDQKRDKASFLLEVIEYIQILKEKVKKYENVEHGRHQDRLKSMVWDLCKRSGGAPDSSLGLDPSRLDSLVLAKEYSSPVSGVLDIKQSVQSPFARTVGGYPVTSKSEPGVANPTATISNSSYEREKFNNEASESLHYPGRGRPYGFGATGIVGGVATQDPLHQQQQVEQRFYGGQGARLAQSDTGHSQVLNEEGGSNLKPFPPGAGAAADQRQYSPPASYGGPSSRQPSPRGVQATANEPSLSVAGRHPPSNTSREPSQQEDSRAPSSAGQDPLAIQGGVINVSSVYSQGLLDTLTKALQSSGLDLSQANISVQIDLGKTTAAVSPKVAQTPESSTQSHQSQEHTRQTVSYPDQDLQTPHKRPKIEVDV